MPVDPEVFNSTIELAKRYDLIEVTGGGTILVKDGELGRQLSTYADEIPAKPDYRELGGTGQSNYTGVAREDYNPELRGWFGLQTYEKMRKNDGQIRATLRLVKTPVLAARWYVDTQDETKRGQIISDHVHNCFFNWMSTSWPQLLTEILLMLDFGYYPFEKVYDFHEGKVIWRKFAPRHPTDVSGWKFDKNGGPTAMSMYMRTAPFGEVTIPMDKMAVFTFEKEGGDMTGVSVLRSAYKHWFYKENLYKIDAIQKERHGIGIPIIKLPANFNPNDRALADEIGRNLRTNEKAHIVLPPNWDLAMLKLEGQPVDALTSVDHHDMMIARNILGQFINNPLGTSQEEQQTLFLKATRYIAEVIRDVFNKYCIPQLVIWNWGERDIYPELRVRRIGDTVDWRTVSFAIRNFVGAGVLIPDDKLEAWVRDEMDLPKADMGSQRFVANLDTPQGEETPDEGGLDNSSQNADMPRQSKAGGMKKTVPGPNAGGDKSGG
jgi:hypothetical protein